ncbi:STAS domain-containing protein [Paenibacillus sp. Z6-24]
MLATVAVVVVTDNLALGVITGILLSTVFFAAPISSIGVRCKETPEGIGYTITGQLFFASVEGFVNAFDFTQTDTDIITDFTEAHIWDDSGVGAVDRMVIRLREQGNRVTVKGLNASSEKMINRLAVYQDAGTRIKSH